MKRIIFTVTNDLTYDQRMQRICSTLALAGYDVLLIGRKLKSSAPLTTAGYKQTRLNCWFVKGKLFYAEFNIRLFFFLLFKRTNCICAIDLDTILPAWLVSKIRNVKRVYDAHEYFSQLNEVISRPGIYRFWHWVEKKMIPVFPHGYTVCESIAEEFRKNYKSDYKVIRNVPVLTPVRDDIKKDKIIFYQGAVNKGRGLDELVKAMKQVETKLLVCGDGNFMSEMKETVSANDLSGKIVFTGMLKPDELKFKTAQAYIAINPFEKNGLNQYLSLSNKFFDYIHAGIPQVTMNYPEYKKINDRYNIALLIDELTADSIAGAINKLLNDETLYSQLKQNCQKARDDLNWQNEKSRLLDFYYNLFNE